MLVICKTILHVASLAADAETKGVFTNAQLALPIRHALEAGLDHPQPPKPLKLDNSTTTGLVNKNIHQTKCLNLGTCSITSSKISKRNN